MTNVYVEPDGDKFQIEFADHAAPIKGFKTQKDAIDKAKSMGHSPLVARVRNINDKVKPDHWRSA